MTDDSRGADLRGLGVLDWLVVTFYISALLIFGLLLSRRQFRTVDYFLASRSSRWPVIGLALLASNMSATALVGLAGGAYAVGIAVFDYEWSAVVVLVFFCIFVAPLLLASQVYTMPEFLERRYDRRVRIHFSLLTLFLNVVVDSAGVLYCGSLVCQLLFPSWPLWAIVLVLGASGGLYAILGGLRAVIYTEAVQAIVLLIGAVLIAFGAFSRVGGWHALVSQVNPAALSLIRPVSDPGLPWPGLVLGIPLLGFYYWCTNQSIVQRVLSAHSLEHARWGAMLAGALKLPVLFLIVLPGTCALLLFPHISHADRVYPSLVMELLPAGALGLVVAGFIAATTVSIAALFNSASTLITMDVIKRFRPALSDAHLVLTGRLTTAALLLFAVAWAPQLQHFTSLWQYLQAVLAYVVPPIVAVFGVGLFWRRASADGAAAAMRLGSLCGLAAFLINVVFQWTHLHFLYVAPILFLIDVLILVSVSVQTPAPDAAQFVPQMWQREAHPAIPVPFWKDYRYQAAALLVATTALVVAFR
jgi:SSS family solute:Na+ symporter